MLETEKEALTKENDEESKKRLEILEKELAELKEKNNEMTAKYEKEKAHILEVRDLKTKLDEARGALERAERDYDLNRVAELKYGTIPELEQKVQEKEKDMEKNYEIGRASCR